MQPWERRLKDAAILLGACGSTYFNPERFRLNTNQFLQTARTITFLIQKQKENIPNFSNWYDMNVRDPWARDEVMSWAKDSRNTIEKQGDLESVSELRIRLLLSYDDEENLDFDIDNESLLMLAPKRIVRWAQKRLPSSVSDGGVIKVERRWICNTLTSYELVYALTYVYSRLFEVVKNLGAHIGVSLEASIPEPQLLDPVANDVFKASYFKLSDPRPIRIKTHRIKRDREFVPPPALISLKGELDALPTPISLSDLVKRYARMAETTFTDFGSHIPTLSMFDDNWNLVDIMSTEFGDQADKYIFWNAAADRASYLRARAFIWACEAWVRDTKLYPTRPFRSLPIIGEKLQVLGCDFLGKTELRSWNIVRAADEDPKLESVEEDMGFNFVKPMVAAMQKARRSIPK